MKTKKEVLSALRLIEKFSSQHSIAIEQELELVRSKINEVEEAASSPLSSSKFPLPSDIKPGSDDYFVYSDGACRGNPGIGAYGFLVQNNEGQVIKEGNGFYPDTTNNQMELLGAIEGIKSAAQNCADKIYVYSDSRYLVDGINKWVAGWKKRGWKKADKKVPENLSLWKQVDELNESFNLEFYWVKGHSGHPQNERCDELANICIDENL